MIKRLNIFEIKDKLKNKSNIKKISYNKILESCHKKIMRNVENNKNKTIISIPENIYGYPLYDLNKCIKYIIEHLKQDGFVVLYIFPNFLYISWGEEEDSNSLLTSNQNSENSLKIKKNKLDKNLLKM